MGIGRWIFGGIVILTRPEYILFPILFVFYLIRVNRKYILEIFKKSSVFIIAVLMG